MEQKPRRSMQKTNKQTNIKPKNFLSTSTSKFEKLFELLKKKKYCLLEENKSHARQSRTFITTIVSNNSYNEITDTSEINSCYRKWIIFYLNSNATRITWQQHNSVETMSVFDEEITLAPEYCIVTWCSKLYLEGTEKY